MNALRRFGGRAFRSLRANVDDFFGERIRAGIEAYRATPGADAAGPGAPAPRTAVDEAALARALSGLGVRSGDILLVHASISQICGGTPTRDDHRAALRGLRAAVGSDGTLAMPTQSVRSAYEFAGERRIFEPGRHVSIFGALTEEFRKSEGTIRSLNPWCNLTAQGPKAAELLADHELRSPFAAGPDTPWHRLATAGAKIVLIGVDIVVNTSFILPQHFLGRAYPIPVFVDKPLTFLYRRRDGGVGETEQILDVHDWSKDQVRAYARGLDAKYGLYRSCRHAAGSITLFEAKAHFEAMLKEVTLGNYYSRPGFGAGSSS